MCKKKAEEFAQIWEELGANYDNMEEDELIAKEMELFRLKAELEVTDVPYIMDHISQSRAIKNALISFLE